MSHIGESMNDQNTVKNITGKEIVEIKEESLKEVVFSKCKFKHVELSTKKFTECKFEDCEFIRCNLNNCDFPASAFQDCIFDKCRMIGIDWSKTRGLYFKINCTECNLSYSTFTNMKMPNCKFNDCIMEEVYFYDSKLQKVKFCGSNLKKSVFMNCDMTETDFTLAESYFFDPRQNKLKKTKLSRDQAVSLLSAFNVVIVDDDKDVNDR